VHVVQVQANCNKATHNGEHHRRRQAEQQQTVDGLQGPSSRTGRQIVLTRRTYIGLGPSERVDITYNKEGSSTTRTRHSDLAGATLVATSSLPRRGCIPKPRVAQRTLGLLSIRRSVPRRRSIKGMPGR